jgi:hypothetical protein
LLDMLSSPLRPCLFDKLSRPVRLNTPPEPDPGLIRLPRGRGDDMRGFGVSLGDGAAEEPRAGVGGLCCGSGSRGTGEATAKMESALCRGAIIGLSSGSCPSPCP